MVFKPIQAQKLAADLLAIGIRKGAIVNVKASLRSIGKMANGADTLIDALKSVVGEDGTIITDSFVLVYPLGSKQYKMQIVDQMTPSYAGALANAMISHKNSERSFHPVQKFALIGKRAKELAENHDENSYAYDILRIIAETGGVNLKIGPDETVPGVGTSHVAIGLANIKQKIAKLGVKHITKDGEIKDFIVNWSGGCVKAFYNLNELYNNTAGAVLGRGMVGNAPAKLTDMKKTLSAELEYIRKDPAGFLKCSDPECFTCSLTWEISHESFLKYFTRMLIRGKWRKAIYARKIFSFSYPY